MTPVQLSFLSRTEHRWFWISIGLSALVVLIYLCLHCSDDSESEIHFLSKGELSIALTLLDSQDTNKSDRREILIHYLTMVLDIKPTETSDKAVAKEEPSRKEKEDALSQPRSAPGDERHVGVVHAQLFELMAPYSLDQLKLVLPTMPFRVKSHFWLQGPLTMVEIIFWSLFGLIASVLYRVSEAISKREFDIRKTPIHIAKIIYAPLSAIVIIFSINALTTSNGNPFEEIDYGLIVFSFILGFFSGRTVDLLKRLKDIILPLGGSEDQSAQSTADAYQLRGHLQFGHLNTPPTQIKWQNVQLTARSLQHRQQEEVVATIRRNGHFTFPLLPAGKYLLTAKYSVGEQQFGKQQAIVVGPAIERQELSITLNELDVQPKV